MLYEMEKIHKSLYSVEEWMIANDFKGFEPFDGLSSYLYPLTFGSRFLRQVLQQIVRRFPVNIRLFLGVKPLDSTKGRGYIAWGYIKLFEATKKEEYKIKALEQLDWLDKNKSPLYPNHSWGNHFNYAARAGYIWKDVSTIVWTGLIGQAFLEAYKLWGVKRHLEVIASIKDWIMALPRNETENGVCLGYTMAGKSNIHNSSMIGAAFLAGAGKLLGEKEPFELAHRAMQYSCSDQMGNGAWNYGYNKMFHWIDVFHTGYHLDSLKRYAEYSGDHTFDNNIERGLSFFKSNFFEPSGKVKYYFNKANPTDIQCNSQAIDTLVLFSDRDPECLDMAYKSAIWTIDNMQDKKGFFYFRLYKFGIKNKAPMIHWGQGTMFKALAFLKLKIKEQS